MSYTVRGRFRVGTALREWTQDIDLSDEEWTYVDLAIPQAIDPSQAEWFTDLIVRVESWNASGSSHHRTIAPPLALAYPDGEPALWLATEARRRFPYGRVTEAIAAPLVEGGAIGSYAPPSARLSVVVEE